MSERVCSMCDGPHIYGQKRWRPAAAPPSPRNPFRGDRAPAAMPVPLMGARARREAEAEWWLAARRAVR